MTVDPRRLVPRTDAVLADPRLVAAAHRLGPGVVRGAVRDAQQRARIGAIAPDAVADAAVCALPVNSSGLTAVLNATGVVLHTNLGRAPLSAAAVDAMTAAAGYVDVEFDLAGGRRATRGRGTLDALLEAVPGAEAAMAVNNGAGALVLATTALAGCREVLISRGEMVEIGAGFRLADLITSTGVKIREVGSTNRTELSDYRRAIGDDTAAIVKIHPSNFQVTGFTSSVPVKALAGLGLPVIADVGSGLLQPDPLLPDEPDVRTALRDGAAVVTCSGDKLLGGPQAGLVLGVATAVESMRRHPLARAFRLDKVSLAALEATLRGPIPSARRYLHADPERLRWRCENIAADMGFEVVRSDGAVGGGSAPGIALPGWAIALPVALARPLRLGRPSVVGRVERNRLLIDLRCVPEDDDPAVRKAITAALAGQDG